MEFEEETPFISDNGSSQTQEVGIFSSPRPLNSDLVVSMEEATSCTLKDLDMDMNLFESSIIEEPMATVDPSTSIHGFLHLNAACSPPGSDIWDSCPPSPSPVSSPSPNCSSSSESGIEDISDVEETSHHSTVFEAGITGVYSLDNSQVPATDQLIKKETPSSPLNTDMTWNSLLESSNTESKRGRVLRKCRRASNNVLDATEELTRLIENITSSAQLSSQHSSKPTQTEAISTADILSMSGFVGVRPATVPTSEPSHVPLTVQSSQAHTVAGGNCISLSHLTSTSTVTKTTSVPASTTQPRLRAKPTKAPKKLDEPRMMILEEPEENYRARYESEGCRGPIHGSKDNTFPTVKVTGVSDSLWITVHLTTSSGQPHYHSIHGPGSTKVPCKEITLPGGIPAVQVMVAPDNNMTAVLDSLSIRRLRNWEGDRELKKRGIDPRTWKKERKEARLLFQTEIPESNGQPAVKLTCKSKVFQCSSSGPPGIPEIWWASVTEGSVEGGDELGLIGKKFQSGFKVRFFSEKPSGEVWEGFAEVDRSKSHQGAAVVVTPAYCDTDISSPITVSVVVTFGNGAGTKSSEPIEFTYKPKAHAEVQEIEMHASLPVSTPDALLPVELFANIGDVVLNSLEQEIVESPPMVVPDLSHQSDDNDWQCLCIQIAELHQKGELSSQHVKELCDYIKRKDTLLLQAFRSSRNAGTTEELQANFKQYLSGMLCNL